MRSGGGILLPRHTAANSFQFKTRILSGLYGAANGFPNEGWDFDSALLDVQDHSSRAWNFWRRCGVLRCSWSFWRLRLNICTRYRLVLTQRGLDHGSVTASIRGRARHTGLANRAGCISGIYFCRFQRLAGMIRGSFFQVFIFHLGLRQQ